MTDRQSEQERESDAAFVERIGREYDSMESDPNPPEMRRLITLARRAAVIPDAGAEDVERVARALRDFRFPPTRSTGERCRMLLTQNQAEMLARAALAVMPRRDERAGMLRAAEIADRLEAVCEASRVHAERVRDHSASYHLWARDEAKRVAATIRAEAEALRTSTPEQPRDDGWQPIETAPKDGTRVDLWILGREGGYREADASWGAPDHSCGEAGQYCDCCPPSAAWRDSILQYIEEDGEGGLPQVTHWRPLPPAPVTK